MSKRVIVGILLLSLALIAGAFNIGGRLFSGNEDTAASLTASTKTSTETVAVTTGNQTGESDAGASRFEPLTPAAPPSPARIVRLPIVMYHHVGEPPPGADSIRQGLTVSSEDFEAQMAYLKQAGYQPLSQTQLFRALFEGAALPEKPVMLTFDDGYLDNLQIAAPALQRYGFAATFYIITEKVGTPEYMDWNQVAQVDRMGVDIGSHTASHPDLTGLPAEELSGELSGSAETLKAHLGHPVYWLCYPAGRYDSDVMRYAGAAGYLLAVTTEPGEKQSSDSPLELYRYRVRSDTSLEGFKELVR